MVISSGTSRPRSKYSAARRPAGVPAAFCSRNIAPTEGAWKPNFSFNSSAWVPLPAAGGPSNTRRRYTRATLLPEMGGEKEAYADDEEDRRGYARPYKNVLLHRLAASADGLVKGTAANAPLAQEPVVVPLDEMRLHLAHRIEHDANENQQAGAAEERGGELRHAELMREHLRQDRDHGQENCAGKRQAR